MEPTPPTGLKRFMEFMEGLHPGIGSELKNVYEPEASFEDPINQAKGLEQLDAVYADLFKQLQDIRIRVMDHAVGTSRHYVSWQMAYAFRRRPRQLDGVSELQLGTSGKICWQRDHWDATVGVYQEFPLVGGLLRSIKRLVKVKFPRTP